jgi:hypothetical protein
MPEENKITDKAAELAAQAAAAAAPIASKAGELAGTAAAAAGPIAHQAKERATALAEKAGAAGAKGVSAVAEGLDKATGGRFADQISSVTSRIEEKIHPDQVTPTARTAGPQAAAAPTADPEAESAPPSSVDPVADAVDPE